MSTDNEKEQEFDFRGHLRTVSAYKWLILGATLVGGAGAAFWSMKQPRLFETKAMLEFDPNPVRPLGSDVEDVADPIGSFWSAREFFATQNRVIASRNVAERVVRRLGLHEDPTFWGESANGFTPHEITDTAIRLKEMIEVEPVEETRLVNIRIKWTNPEQAAAIADAFAEEYIEKTTADRLSSTVSALEWLERQLDALRNKLEDSELALHTFKEDHNVLSVSMEDRQNLVASEMESLNTALTDATKRRIEISARVERLRSALGTDVLEASGSIFDERSGLQPLRESLRTKLAERDRLRARLGAAHPDMLAIDQEIESLRGQLELEIRTIVTSAEGDLREVQSIERGFSGALQVAQQDGLELNLREIEFQRLNRERENNSKLYEIVLERTTETDLTRMLRTTHVRLIDRALVPKFPVSPNRTMNTLAGLLVGLLLGLGGAFALRFLDRRLRGPDAVEELGVTVLGVIPHVAELANAEGSGKRRRKRAERPTGADLVVHTHPTSSAAECVRTVRTNLTFMSVGGPDSTKARVFVVTSSQPREGKTTVACNLAASIAQSGRRVLLVDTDLRKPRVHSSFAVSKERGVSTFVIGETSFESVTQQSHIPNLDIATSGPIPPNPAELLHSAKFAEFVATARKKYEVVIFDSPPLGAVTDAAVIAPQVDGVLLVVKAGVTTRVAVRSTVRQLRDVHARILGAVMNSLDLTKQSDYGEGYYYQRYGEYYGAGEQDATSKPS